MNARVNGAPGVLLDVNVLVALYWRPHVAHATALSWFQRHGHSDWATNAFTQAAFVRLVSNPAFTRNAPSAAAAANLLAEGIRHPGHRFWPITIPYAQAVTGFALRVFGHRQVTDAYLLGLTLHVGGRFVTLDSSFHSLLPPGHPGHAAILELNA